MLHLLVTHPACSPPGGSFMCGEWFPTPHQSMESKGGIPVHKVRQSEAYEKKKKGSRGQSSGSTATIIKIQVCWHASNRLQDSMHCLLWPQRCLKDNRKRWWSYRRHISSVYMCFLISPHGAHATCVILCLKQAAWVHTIHARPLVRGTPLGHEKAWLFFWRCPTQGNSQSPLTAVRVTSFPHWGSRPDPFFLSSRQSAVHMEEGQEEGSEPSCSPLPPRTEWSWRHQSLLHCLNGHHSANCELSKTNPEMQQVEGIGLRV